jgi:hypothetical protein
MTLPGDHDRRAATADTHPWNAWIPFPVGAASGRRETG